MKPTNDDVQRLVTALMECVRSIERAKRKGLASQFVIMQVLAAQKQALPSALSAETGFHLSYVTRQIQALERLGFVKVSANPADGRSRLVTLTKAGRAEIGHLAKVGLKRFSLFVADWDSSEVQLLASLLEKFEKSKADVNKRVQQPMGRTNSDPEE